MQAGPGAEQGAGAVRFDRTAFEGEVDRPMTRVRHEQALVDQAFGQRVVARGLELAAPAGEAEVVEDVTVGTDEGDRAGVARRCRRSRS